MSRFLIVAGGGALGAILRYSVSLITTKFFETSYPWATVLVNLIGAFAIGFLWGVFEVKSAEKMKSFVLVGLIGSFTTFSTLSLDVFNLMKTGQTKLALYHLTLTNILGVILVILGYFLSKKAIKLAAAYL